MAHEDFKRPFSTSYFSDPDAPLPSHTQKGASVSPENAVRASVYRIFTGQYAKAVIYDRRTATPVYTVRFGPQGLRVSYGSAGERATLRRVA